MLVQKAKGYIAALGPIWTTIGELSFIPSKLEEMGMKKCLYDSFELKTNVIKMNQKLEEFTANGQMKVIACQTAWD